MKPVLFSVIIPVYNTEEYLKKCVDSVLSQTLSDYEILLIDDNSTDNSSLLCDSYQEQNNCIKTYHLVSNRGLSAARNYGVEHATGKYIIFVDSDDWIKKNALENLWLCIQKNKDIEIITSNGKILVYKGHEFLSQYSIPFEKLNGEDGIAWVEAFLKAGVDDWHAPGKCFNRKFWVDNGFLFKEGRLAEDMDLIYKVLIKAKVMSCCDTFYYYRQVRPGSTITSGSEKLVNSNILNLQEWSEYLQETSFLSCEQKQLLFNRLSKLYCTSVLGMIYAFPIRIRKELMKKAEEIDYYLYMGNNRLTRISRIIEKMFNRDILCFCLYIARQLFRYCTRIKWMLLGSSMKSGNYSIKY